MAVYDKEFLWTDEADAFDNELRTTLKPIIDKAFESGLRVEDIHYIIGNCVFDELLTIVLLERSKIEKSHIKE
jgi:hypothetical protein